MCGRYTLTHPAKINERFGAGILGDKDIQPNFNVAPGQTMPVVVDVEGKNQIQLMKWGLVPSWAKDSRVGYKMINARSEGIENKPSFRHAFKSQRCLVPASGFYEWKKADTNKIPYYITQADQDVFSFAGLWEYWQQPNGEALHTYTIITASANPTMEPIHDRMPVMVKPQLEDDWLNSKNQDPEFLRQLLQASHEVDLKLTQVSTEVNKVANNHAGLINSA